LQFTAMNAVTLGGLDPKTASSGNSLLSVVQQLSMSLGVATSSLFLLMFSGVSVESARPGVDLLPAFHNTYMAVGAMAALASFIFFQLRPEEGEVGPAATAAADSIQD